MSHKSSTGYTKPGHKKCLFLLGTALCLGVLIWQITGLFQDRLMNEIYREASVELTANTSALSLALERGLLLSSGLKAFVDTELRYGDGIDSARFETFAASFLQETKGVRNLSIYPNGIAKFVYPLVGNEQLPGLDLFSHPDNEVRQNAIRTRDMKAPTILGPFRLMQGGLGLLSRQSVYEGEQFWGFTTVVLDVPQILEEAGLTHGNKGIDLSVRANGSVLLGDPQLFDTPRLLQQLHLFEGYWELSAVPKQEKINIIHLKINVIRTLGALCLLLLLYFMYVHLTQKDRLHAMVQDRTENLVEANRRLEQTYGELTAAEEELRSQYALLEHKEQAVRHMAYHDNVTGLFNRTYFNGRLDELIAESTQSETGLAVLFLDVDHFKMINDTVGHAFGDNVLMEIGRRLSARLVNGETISRFGGDEFTIIVPNLTAHQYAQHIAEEVFQLFQQPFVLKDSEYFISTSIGIAIYPDHGEDATTLVKNADMAMYRAKEEGKNNYRFYDRSLNPAEDRMEIKNSLGRALERDEFQVHYQPQVEASTGRIIGLEALIRWHHPKRGMIPPASFIPVAEETGLIVPIGERVLRMVCSQSKVWQAAGLPPIRIAVNLSPRQFSQKNLAERIKAILAETRLDPKYLELEITENMAMKDNNLATLQELRNMGITISIDDFGTQYSSLSYLKRLPVNKIKIDRSFVNGISKDQKDEAIILAMLLIARRLNLTVIAEGVETRDQFHFLQNNDCTDIQGYLFHKPQPAESIETLLRANA